MAQPSGLSQRLSQWTYTVADAHLDGWLIADFRWNNPLFARLLGLHAGIVTRRCFLWLPAAGNGEPFVLASRVDGHTMSGLPCAVRLYTGYDDMVAQLQAALPPGGTVAMEYVPGGTLPTVSRVDGGLLDMLRSWGIIIVTSGSLIAAAETWDERQQSLHLRAARGVDEARALALRWVGERLRQADPFSEGEVAAFIASYFKDHGLGALDGPDVAINANAADPHYATGGAKGAPVGRDAVLLIDLWTQVRDAQDAPYADSTWMSFTGSQPPGDVLAAFEAVRGARDAALEAIAGAARGGSSISGRAVDGAARRAFADLGLAEGVFHRTGHSLGSDHVHGMGANLDAVEFPDDRPLLVNSGFTVEPGLYYPGRFGMRLEVSAMLLPDGLKVTTDLQTALTLFDS